MTLPAPLPVRKMLDYVDCESTKNNPVCKRRDAYVTEKYFETEILPVLANGSKSTGWCYIEHDWVRYWFKVIINIHDAEFDTDRAIIQKLKKIDARQEFYIVYMDSDGKNNSIALRKIIEKKGDIFLRRASSEFCDVDRMNQEAERLSRLSEHPSPFSDKWLVNYKEQDLKTLLIQRLLMNIGLGKKYPLDVDAIEINDDQLIFHEFKRKNKCPNGCFIVNGKTLSRFDLLSIPKECIENKLEYGTKLFEFVEDGLSETPTITI